MRLLLGATAVLLAIALALTTPWARSVVLDQASAWASNRFGVEIRAARLDYRLTSLSFTLQEVAVADRAAGGQPFFRADRVEIDLAGSALRGRLDVDRIHLLRPRVVIDSTTRPGPRTGADAGDLAGTAASPLFEIGLLEVEGLDVTTGDTDDTRIEVRQVSGTLRGRGSQQLEGDLAALGGVGLSFETDDVRLAFDRAQARIVLDASRRLVTGALTASSPVANLRAEGNLGLGRGAEFDLRYHAEGRLEQLGRWWPASPGWQGPVTLQGQVRGPLTRPEATVAAKVTDLRWATLQGAAIDGAGQVSIEGLVLDAFSLTSPQGKLQGSGRFTFRRDGRGEVAARWTDVDGTVITGLVPATAGDLPHAHLSGSATLAWPGRLPAASTTEGKVDTTAIAVAPEASATATLAANGRAGRWQVNVQHTLDGIADAALDCVVVADPGQLTRSPVSGSIVVHADNPRATLAQLQRLGVPLPQAVSAMDASIFAAEGTLTGSLGAPRATLRVGLTGLRAGELSDINVMGNVTLDTSAIAVSTMASHSLAGEVTLDGVLPWSAPTGRGKVVAHVREIAALAFGLPRLWRPVGALEVTGEWNGSARSPGLTAHFSGPNLGLNGLLLDAVTGDLSLADGLVSVTNLKASQSGGTFDASGSWRLGDSSLTAAIRARNLAMQLLAEGAQGHRTLGRLSGLSLDADISGTVARPDGVVSLDVGSAALDVGGSGDVDSRQLLFNNLQARVESASGVARVTASAPNDGVSIDGRLTFDTPRPFDGRVSLTGTDVARLARLAGLADEYVKDLAVSADATVDLSGTVQDLQNVNVDLALTRLDGEARGHHLALAGRSRTRLDRGVIEIVEPTRLTIGESTLGIAKSSAAVTGAELVVTLDGPIADLTSLAPGLMPEGTTAEGTVKAEVLLGARLGTFQPTGQATLELATLLRGEQALASGVKVVADADTTTIRLSDFSGTVLGSPVAGVATIPMQWLREGTSPGSNASDAATFSLRSTVAVGPMLAGLMDQPPSDLTGTLNLTVDGTASAPRLDSVLARVQEQGGALTMGNMKLSTQRTTALRFENGLLHVDAFEWTGPQSAIVASGSVGVLEGASGRLHLDGTASMALLNLMVPARVGGRSTFDVEVTGPRGARDLQGTIAIEDGSMVVQPWRLALADWSGSLVIDATGIAVRGLHGQFNGGEATIEGRLPAGRFAASGDALAITLRSAFLELPRGLRSQLDADLSWSRATSGTRLSGKATVTARAYREPVTELARLASVLIDGAGRSPVELPALLGSTALDVQLSTIGPLSMVNSVARVELQPELHLTGTLAKPALNGQVAVADDGRITVSGRQYRLRDSRIEFRPERGMMPRLDVTGNTRVGDYTVYLRLTGAANEIETSLMSDPPLGERDLQTLLVTGQRETLSGDSNSDQAAVGAASGDVLGFAGQFLGFDSVVVGTTDDLALVSSDVDPALRLTVSKRLGNRFELVLSDNLDDNELTWVIIYRPRPGFEFRAISRGSSEFTGEFRQEIPFGPGVSPPRIAPRRRVVPDRIVSVTVSGEPGLAEAEVLSAASLKTGDHFDFGRWVDDRERIGRLYLDRGFFSARIVPTRRAIHHTGVESQVALDYRITRGPRTVLTMSGYNPPQPLVDQLRQTWADSGLVDLIGPDLELVVRNHLAGLGYLRASVKANVDETVANQLTASVQVEPGPVTTERHLAFSGNTVLSEKELLNLALPGNLDGEAWKNPAALLETVESAYAARGYLAARATAGEIAFAGSAATLPIRIVEGPIARIATFTVTGGTAGGEKEAIAATGLSVGSAYVAGGDQALRLAMERHYRNLGYRDVSIEASTKVNAAGGRVDIVASVHEGPLYLVQSVRTKGVESTRDALVERATRIQAGAPASPELAESTRRQLYDIGTFRSAEVTFEPAPSAAPTATLVPVDAVVSVQESRRFLFLYGLEATNQYESLFDKRISSGGVAADLRDRNFLGRGWTLGAGLRYEPSFQSARALMSVPRLGSKRIRTNVYLDTRTEDRARTEDVIFRDDETSVTLEQRWRVKAPIELSWGYHFDYRDIHFVAAETEQTLVRFSGYLAGLAGAIVVDRRDNMFDARKGWLFSTSAEWGLRALGSDFDYLRTLVRGSFYQPLGPLTLASNARWGNLQPLAGRPPLTVLDIFYQAGGTQTVRGYKQDALSAYRLLDSPVGGTKLLVFNQEIRFPLFWLLSGVAFADAGNTFTDEAGVVLSDLAVGVGFGLRIRTPLAPIRIDLGFPKYGNPTGSTSARWHFSIGQIF